MQIILASAKIMSDKLKSVPSVSLSLPRFQDEAQAFAKDMARYSTETIAEMLGCSQQIAVQNRMRYVGFFEDAPQLPAILAYHGQAYKHLKAETLNVDDLNYAQGKLWLTSFLYGLLRPLDGILPYRMEGNIQQDQDMATVAVIPHSCDSLTMLHPFLYSIFCPNAAPNKCCCKRCVMDYTLRAG